jgi:hypothetical protein
VSATPAIPEEMTMIQSLLLIPMILKKINAIIKNTNETTNCPDPMPRLKAKN